MKTQVHWKKVGRVYVAEFFFEGVLITATLSPDRTTTAAAEQIGTANRESFGAALKLPDGRWFHPTVSRVDRARVHFNSGMSKERALANAWAEEKEAAHRFLDAEKGIPHLYLLVVQAKRGTLHERMETGELDMPVTRFNGPTNGYSKMAIEMAAETSAKVLKVIRSLVDVKAA